MNQIVLAQLWLTVGHSVGCGAADGLTIAVGVSAVGEGLWRRQNGSAQRKLSGQGFSFPDGTSFPPLVLHIKSLKHYASSDHLFASPRASQSRKCLHLTLIQTQSLNSAMFMPELASHLQFCQKQLVFGSDCPREAEVVCDGAVWLRCPQDSWSMGVHPPLPSSMASKSPSSSSLTQLPALLPVGEKGHHVTMSPPQSHTLGWVGSDLRDHPHPTPCHGHLLEAQSHIQLLHGFKKIT